MQRSWMRRFLGPAVAIVALAAVATSTEAARAPDPATATIAVIVPMSGSDASVGQQSINAAKLAVKAINAGGGIHSLGGTKLKLVVADSSSTEPQTAANAATQVFSTHTVSAAFGMDLSGLCAAALPVLDRFHVPMLSACIANTLLGNPYFFQVAPTGNAFGKLEVQFVEFLNRKYHLKLHKAAVIYVNNPYGQTTAQGVISLIKQAHLDLVLNTGYPENITNASPVIAAIKRSGAQVVFPVSYIPDAELIISAIDEAHLKVLLIGGGAGFIWPPIGQALGSRVNGLTSVASWNWDSSNVLRSPSLYKVTQQYLHTYHTFMPEQAGEAYAAIWDIADAMNLAKSTSSTAVRSALARLRESSGGAAMMQPGVLRFAKNGANLYTTPVMIQWQGGVPRTVFPVKDATAKVHMP